MRYKPFAVVALVCAGLGLSTAVLAADTYKVDPVHSSVLFRAQHAQAGFTWGRFNDPSGSFVLDDADPAKCSFFVEIAVANIDTHNDRRDADLKSPDFFNAKQYPTISFKSTGVKKGEGNTLQVTGDVTLHGATKPITLTVELAGKGEFPAGTKRAGVEATFTVKMSDFGIKGMPGAVSDEIKLIVALEGTRQ